MKKASLALAAPLLLLTAVAAAQEAPAPGESPAGPSYQTVTFSGFDYQLDPAQAWVGYVTDRHEDLDGVEVTIQPFARMPSGQFVPLAPFPTEATGALATAAVGDELFLVLVQNGEGR